MEFKNPYALRDGKIVYIEDLNPSERGLACNCVCPCCGKRMIAKLGKVNEHHFAHYESPDCSGGYETALHLLAKELLAEGAPLLLPSCYSHFNNVYGTIMHEDGTLFQVVREISSTSIIPDEVKIEKGLNSIRPDLLVYKKGKPLIVEIFVSHAVDEQKLEKIKEMRISAIEIDLSEYKSTVLTREELANSLSTRYDNKKWLNNEKMRAYDSKIQNNIDKLFRVEELKTKIKLTTNILANKFKYKICYDYIYDCPKKPQFDGKHCYAKTRNCLTCNNFYCFLQRIDNSNDRFVLCKLAKTKSNTPSQNQIIDYIRHKTKDLRATDEDKDEDIRQKIEEVLSDLAPEYKKMVNCEAIINKKIPEIRKWEENRIYRLLYGKIKSWTNSTFIDDLYEISLEKNKKIFLASHPEFQQIPSSKYNDIFKKFFDMHWKDQIMSVQRNKAEEANHIIEIVLERVPRANYKNYATWFQSCVSFMDEIKHVCFKRYTHVISIVPYFQEYLEKRHIK